MATATALPKRSEARIEDTWKSMAPGQPFHYSFMEDDFNNIYQTEQRMGSISLSFSLLAICIACLGPAVHGFSLAGIDRGSDCLSPGLVGHA